MLAPAVARAFRPPGSAYRWSRRCSPAAYSFSLAVHRSATTSSRGGTAATSSLPAAAPGGVAARREGSVCATASPQGGVARDAASRRYRHVAFLQIPQPSPVIAAAAHRASLPLPPPSERYARPAAAVAAVAAALPLPPAFRCRAPDKQILLVYKLFRLDLMASLHTCLPSFHSFFAADAILFSPAAADAVKLDAADFFAADFAFLFSDFAASV